MIVIETDTNNFQAGDLNIIDGGVTTVAAYEPAAPSPVPEPNFSLLLSIALLGFVGFRQFAKARQNRHRIAINRPPVMPSERSCILPKL